MKKEKKGTKKQNKIKILSPKGNVTTERVVRQKSLY
jgi:hypothetical protein